MASPAPQPCTCAECAALDRAHPREGRQLALVRDSSGERPVSLPLTDPDAPAVPAADVSAPEGRPVETHALAAEAGDPPLMNAHTSIAKPRGRKKADDTPPAAPAAEILPPLPATPRLVPSSPRPIALRRLRRAPENVRHTRIDEDVATLADDIAAHGLLQSLIGYATLRERPDHLMPGEYPEDADVDTIAWDVAGGLVHIVGGGRRFQALRELENRGLIDGDFPVPVLIRSAEDAIELSLAENLQQRTMSPVDEFFGFQQLMQRGNTSPAQLAARFGFSERVVKQRLRLAQLDPEVLDALAQRQITIDAAMAYASSQDRELQREVFKLEAKKSWEPHKVRDIRHSLAMKGIRTDSPLFVYVGAASYEEAGGGYEDDLFLEERDAGRVLAHPHILQDLAAQKIRREAEQRLDEWRARADLSPTIVGYVLTHDLRINSYGNGAKEPKGFVRVERWDHAPVWKTIRNNRIDVHVLVGIDSKGELVAWPQALFVPKEQKQAVAPEQPRTAYTEPTPEERAAAARERGVDRLAKRAAVGSFAGTPFEGRAFWPTGYSGDPTRSTQDGVTGWMVPVQIFVTDAAVTAAVPAAETEYDHQLAERAAREKAEADQEAADEAAYQARAAELRAMEPPAVVVVDGEAWIRAEDGTFVPEHDDPDEGGGGESWEGLLVNVDVRDIGATFATRTEYAAAMEAAGADQDEEVQA